MNGVICTGLTVVDDICRAGPHDSRDGLCSAVAEGGSSSNCPACIATWNCARRFLRERLRPRTVRLSPHPVKAAGRAGTHTTTSHAGDPVKPSQRVRFGSTVVDGRTHSRARDRAREQPLPRTGPDATATLLRLVMLRDVRGAG
jgi:hypothetical protein